MGRTLIKQRMSLTPLKILNGAFVFLRRSLRLEGAKISSLTRLRIFLAGIQPVFAGFQLPDHAPSNIRRPIRLRALNCTATPNAIGVAKSGQPGGRLR